MGRWEDMGLYWAWRGAPENYVDNPPTKKRIEYVTLVSSVEGGLSLKLACGVWDDDKFTPLYRDQISRYESLGMKVIWPEGVEGLI